MSDLRKLVLAQLPDEFDDEDDVPMVTFVVVDPAGPDAVLRMQPFGGADIDGWSCTIGVAGSERTRNYDIDARAFAHDVREGEDAAVRDAGTEDIDVQRLHRLAQRVLALWDADQAAAAVT